MVAYVYTWSYPDGTLFYVGISRYAERAQSPRRNVLANSVRAKIEREGGQVLVSMMKVATREEAIAEEMRLIALHGRRVDGSGILTNITLGGEQGVLGLVHRPESREKMSRSHHGVPLSRASVEKRRAKLQGRKFPPEFGQAIAVRMIGNKNGIGRKLSPEHKEKLAAGRRAAYARRLATANGPLDQD